MVTRLAAPTWWIRLAHSRLNSWPEAKRDNHRRKLYRWSYPDLTFSDVYSTDWWMPNTFETMKYLWFSYCLINRDIQFKLIIDMPIIKFLKKYTVVLEKITILILFNCRVNLMLRDATRLHKKFISFFKHTCIIYF